MARLLQVAQLGNPILRTEAMRVENISDSALQELIDDLLATLFDSGGVGIAAPQVYQSLQVIVVSSRPTPTYPDSPMLEPTVMINPEILSQSETAELEWEACLSVPGIAARVLRWQSVVIRYTSRQGQEEERQLKGFPARVFQHEYDHLQGLVYLDRIENVRDIVTAKERLRLMAEGDQRGLSR